MFQKLFIILVALFVSHGLCENRESVTIISQNFEGAIAGWEFSFPLNESDNIGELSFPDSTQSGGSKFMQAVVLKKQVENWHAQIQVPAWHVKENSIYRLSMKAKGDAPIQVSVSYGPNSGTPDEYKEGFSFNLYNKWGYYSGEFSSDIEGYDNLVIAFNLGLNEGTYCFDDIKLEEIDQIDQWDTWYNNADERIDSLRKGTIPLTILDTSKNTVTGTASIKLKNHYFPFGTSLILTDTISKKDSEWSQGKVCSLFNSITIENDFKWVDYEPIRGDIDSSKIHEYTTFADTSDMVLRGHVLVWALQKYGFETHWSNNLSPEELRTAIKERIIRDVALYKDKIHEYDVWNEPFHEMEHFLNTSHLNSDPDNIWELMDSAFHWARSQDATADLYLNEYSVVSGGSTKTLYDLVKGMQERNVPITGIGVQCHFGKNPIEPELIRRRLDLLDELGLKIKITEFDLGTPEDGVSLSEAEMAAEYAKFYRTAFSHPAVDGITMWGFWDRMIWNKPSDQNIGSGLYNIDKSPKMAADSIFKLLKEEWDTDTTVELDSISEIRGFYGTYDIVIENGDNQYEGTFTLAPGSQLDTIRVTQVAGVKTIVSEKNTQRFFSYTDSKRRVVTVEGAASGTPVTLKVMDLRGRVVYQSTAEAVSKMHFSLPNLPAGIYISSVRHGKHHLQQKLLLTR